jgi:TIR domain
MRRDVVFHSHNHLINNQVELTVHVALMAPGTPKDHDFAARLYADFQTTGVRCWFAPEDLKIGDRFRPRIDETIRVYDKLLLVLSKYSVASQWVDQEVATALARERQQGTTILFPIRIDNTVMTLETDWPALIKNSRNIGDFRRWKTHDVYQKAFDRLLRDLTTAAQQLEPQPDHCWPYRCSVHLARCR